MAYNPTFVVLSSVKPLFFNNLKMSCDSWATLEPKTPESNKIVGILQTKLSYRERHEARRGGLETMPLHTLKTAIVNASRA